MATARKSFQTPASVPSIPGQGVTTGRHYRRPLVQFVSWDIVEVCIKESKESFHSTSDPARPPMAMPSKILCTERASTVSRERREESREVGEVLLVVVETEGGGGE